MREIEINKIILHESIWQPKSSHCLHIGVSCPGIHIGFYLYLIVNVILFPKFVSLYNKGWLFIISPIAIWYLALATQCKRTYIWYQTARITEKIVRKSGFQTASPPKSNTRHGTKCQNEGKEIGSLHVNSKKTNRFGYYILYKKNVYCLNLNTN